MQKIIAIICFFIFNLSYSQLTYIVCDNNYDGIYNFSAEDKEKIIRLYQDKNQDAPEVYITSYLDGILKIKNIDSTNPSIEYVCKATLKSPTFFEIAVNSKKEIYLTTAEKTIYKLDDSTCEKTAVSQPFPGDIQALSFDRLDNLYKSNGSSVVYRASNNDFDNFIPWHDFKDGYPSGDFVMVGDKMYISWAYSVFSPKNDLYEVSVDSNFNYISHVNRGAIKGGTWGLASEYGKLYGVSKDELYEINIQDLSTKTILLNPSNSFDKQWWGAAGKHEAQKINNNLFESYEDAQNNINIVQFPYQNKTPLKQTIYLRSENIYTTETKIIPIDLQINLPPLINIENEYTLCYNGDFSTVVVDTKFSPNAYSFKWFYENTELPNDTPILSTQQPGNYKVVVNDKITGCNAEKNFLLKQSDIFINNVTDNQEYLFVDASGTDNPFTYTINGFEQQNPRFDNFPLGEISIFVSNDKKCISKKFLKTISINNVITPNNDGFNDFFELKYPVFKNSNYQISILNNYGETVYQSKLDENFKWNGRNSIGGSLKTGTYWYIIYSPEHEKKYNGFILLRN